MQKGSLLLLLAVTTLLLIQECQGAALGKVPLRRRRQAEVSMTHGKSRDRVDQARLVWLHSLLDALSTPEDDPLLELLFPGDSDTAEAGSDDRERRRRKKDLRHFRQGGYPAYGPPPSIKMLREYVVKKEHQELERQALLAAVLGLVDDTTYNPEAPGHVGGEGGAGPYDMEGYGAPAQLGK